MIIQDTNGLGQVEVTTIPLPDYAKLSSATYLFSGKLLVSFHKEDDAKVKDYYHLAVVNDDGSGFRTIFSGPIPQHKKANGIRYMPFADNRRVLLGDFVLECTPDIDTCEKAELVPVHYPWLLPLDPRIFKHWSEVIIAPDNEHICWTMLRADTGAANCIGVLKREKGRYVIEQTQVVSALTALETDPAKPGYILPQIIRGGEVKQFVKGGKAISLAGAKDGYLADSVVQDLASDEVTQITHTPGYDETTIFSPDECLGMVMSTRGSKKTDLAILGWLPRPYGRFATGALTMYAYMYSVAGVRSFRPGNIGPVLIEIERSMHEPGYQGVLLNDPEEKWVYLSPMSWHPDGKRAMWPEMVRGSSSAPGGPQIRIRKVTLPDYQPGPTVLAQKTPDAVPYGYKGLKGALSLWLPAKTLSEGKIAGKHSGDVEIRKGSGAQPMSFSKSMEVHYNHISDDGKTFFDGVEKVNSSLTAGCRYEADVIMSGEQQGEMKLRLSFSKLTFDLPPRLLFEPAEDGKAKSYGHATYAGVTLRVEDLVE